MVLEGLLIAREQPPCVHSRDSLPNAHCKDKQKILDGQTRQIPTQRWSMYPLCAKSLSESYFLKCLSSRGICHQCIRGKHPLHDFLFVVNNQMPHTSIDQPFVDFPLTVQPLIVLCLYIRLIWQELYGVESITEKPVHKCTGLKKK